MAKEKGFKKTTTKAEDSKIHYVVEEDYGVISENKGWELRFRLVSWNGNDSKYDLRAWKKNEDGTEQCHKGLTLTGEEAENLYNILHHIATGK